MTISLMDIIYIVAISGIVGALYMIESQVKAIKVMMEEHIKFDEKMCDDLRLVEEKIKEKK